MNTIIGATLGGGTGTVNSVPFVGQPPEQPVVHQLTDTLQAEIGYLHERIVILEERLTHVLRPVAGAEGQTGNPEPQLSPLGERMRDFGRIIGSLSKDVQGLIDRLEI